MDVLIKFVSGERITIKGVSSYKCLDCGYWRIDVTGDKAMFFNKELIVYIGNNDISFY